MSHSFCSVSRSRSNRLRSERSESKIFRKFIEKVFFFWQFLVRNLKLKKRYSGILKKNWSSISLHSTCLSVYAYQYICLSVLLAIKNFYFLWSYKSYCFKEFFKNIAHGVERWRLSTRALFAACASMAYSSDFIDLNLKCHIMFSMNVYVIRWNP